MKYPAPYTVHWPTEPIAACEKHAKELQSIGKYLRHHIAVTVAQHPQECSNCILENKNTKEQDTMQRKIILVIIGMTSGDRITVEKESYQEANDFIEDMQTRRYHGSLLTMLGDTKAYLAGQEHISIEYIDHVAIEFIATTEVVKNDSEEATRNPYNR